MSICTLSMISATMLPKLHARLHMRQTMAVVIGQCECGILPVTYLEMLLIEIRVNITTVVCTMR